MHHESDAPAVGDRADEPPGGCRARASRRVPVALMRYAMGGTLRMRRDALEI